MPRRVSKPLPRVLTKSSNPAVRYCFQTCICPCVNRRSGYVLGVSALEVIEQIKALPPQEKAVVVGFVHQLESEGDSPTKSIQFATPAQSKAAGDKIVKQYQPVFKKLAQ